MHARGSQRGDFSDPPLFEPCAVARRSQPAKHRQRRRLLGFEVARLTDVNKAQPAITLAQERASSEKNTPQPSPA
jgi:hypothetical protein